MIDVVVLAVVGLLETDNTIHAMLGQCAVVLGRQRHNLNLDVGEVLLGNVDSLSKIWCASLGWVLAGNEEDILERSQLLDSLILVLYLLWCKDGACHRVLHMKSAVDTRVGARVGDIQRYEHRHCLAESFLCIFARQSCHLLKIRFGGR